MTRSYLSQIETDKKIAFATNAAANTQVALTFTKPVRATGELMLTVYNPSTQTDLTCKVFLTRESLGADDRDALITTLSFAKSQAITGTTINTYAYKISMPYHNLDIKLVFSNDTGTTLTAFDAYARLEQVMEECA
jgi:hypothetical protein